MAGLGYGPPPIVLGGKKDLFIGGLPLPQEGNLPAYKQIEHEMREYLESNFGRIDSVRCPVRKAAQKAAFAFVSFKTLEGAEKMVAAVKPNTKNNISLTLPYAGPTPVNAYVDLIKNSGSPAAHGWNKMDRNYYYSSNFDPLYVLDDEETRELDAKIKRLKDALADPDRYDFTDFLSELPSPPVLVEPMIDQFGQILSPYDWIPPPCLDNSPVLNGGSLPNFWAGASSGVSAIECSTVSYASDESPPSRFNDSFNRQIYGSPEQNKQVEKMVPAVKPNTKNNVSLTLPYAGPTAVNAYVDLVKTPPIVLAGKKDLFIGGLPLPIEGNLPAYQQIELEMKEFLENNFGRVESVRCPVRKAAQKAAFAFVSFETIEGAEKIVAAVKPNTKNNISLTLPYAGPTPVNAYVDLVKNSDSRAAYGGGSARIKGTKQKPVSTFFSRVANQPTKVKEDALQAKMAQYLDAQEKEESLNCELLLAQMPRVLKDLCNILKNEPGCKLEWSRLAGIKGFEEKSKRLQAQSVLLEMTYKSIIDMHATSESCQIVLLKPHLFGI